MAGLGVGQPWFRKYWRTSAPAPEIAGHEWLVPEDQQ
jgi:hypothetical protein